MKQDQLVALFLQRDQLEEMYCNCLTALLQCLPEELLTVFMKHLQTSLAGPELVNVTQDEMGILNTPEGEAYNQKVRDRHDELCVIL